jgi:hypothetical protein
VGNTIKYIIQFLLGKSVSSKVAAKIGYTADESEFKNYAIVIVPSDFFAPDIYGSEQSLPQLPLKSWEETPFLFGEASQYEKNKTTVLKADLIASAYFLISRYEEYARKTVRDIHGRFPGKESLPYRAGFIDRPLVDDYGRLLRQMLRNKGFDAPDPPKEISKIFLTHDVDKISHFRNIRGFAGGVLRGLRHPKEAQVAFASFFGTLKNDPWYTFPYIFKINTSLQKALGTERCECVAFMGAGKGLRKEDLPFANLAHPDFKTVLKACKRHNYTIGLHTSYQAGITPEIIADEKHKLERGAKRKITYNRNHFLCSREPEDMLELIKAGITDDFTMSYADMAGFRLGTCRPVKWINPATRKVTNLKLHSLEIMDMSLSDKRYMFMNSHDAEMYCYQLADNVKNCNGELVLLWHNTSLEHTPRSYHRDLYKKFIKYLQPK